MNRDPSKPMTPIAVVGLGAIFPGSIDTQGFWRDILEGRDRLTEVPRTHWLREDYFHPKPGTPDKVYATRGGFLPEVEFSPLELGLPPNTVPATDTAQLLALVVAKRALEEATRGRLESVDRSRTSVILGVASATELVGHMAGRLQIPVWEHAMRTAGLDDAQVARVSKVLAGQYVPWQENTFPGLLGNVVAGRIANRLDLGGTNAVVDAACAGSLAALSMAVNELALGHSDLVLTGGVDALNDILMFMCFAQTGALSLSGDCRPFSDQADGTMLGEGIGMLALRRLEDAERDGDAIYAVIRGIGSSSDGKAKSIYAPSASGQVLALRRAYERAGYGPESVGLVEAHGTGTQAGDAAEFEALRTVFSEASAPPQRCALGSLKAQFGHTKAAAGSAGLIKAVLALHHKVLPPTTKVAAPNPALGIDESPFYLNTATRPWLSNGATPRRASVSALGFGGTNFHVTLEEYTGPSPRPARVHAAPAELLILGASDPAVLAAACRDAALACASDAALVHLARRQQLAFDATAPARVALVAAGAAEARELLASAAQQIDASGATAFASPRGVYYATGAHEGGVALLFSGQGSQYVGMGADLAVHFDAARAVWDRAHAIVREGDVGLADRVHPRPVFGDAAREALSRALTATEWAQPGIVATSLATLAVLESCGVRPSAVAGHSLGEVSAAVCAGVLDEGAALRVARRRGELMASASPAPGAMTAALADLASVMARVEGTGVTLANHNAPAQVVLAGPLEAIEKAEQRLSEAGVTARRLPVSTAFHSSLVAGAVAPFRAFLDDVPFAPARVALYANTTGGSYPADAVGVRETLAGAIAQPVRFVDEVEALYAAGIRTFVEVGPDAVLTKLVDRCLEGRPHLALPTDQRGRHGVTTLLTTLGRLAVAGVPVSFAALQEGRALPADPAAKPVGFTLKINGANQGKPYPPKTDAPRARSLPEPALAAPPVVAPAATMLAQRVPPPNSEPTLVNDVPPALPATSNPASLEETTDRVAALQRLHAPAIAAQMEFQRLMAESHMAFLRALEASYASVSPVLQVPAVAPAPTEARALATAPATPDVTAVPAAPTPTPHAESPHVATDHAPPTDLAATLLAIVAEKTGYPAEMVDTGMDLEADLGIDSIKRVEILSAMRARVPNLPQVDTAKMGAMRTLAQIIESFGATNGAVAHPPVAAPKPAPSATARPAATGFDAAELMPILLAIVAEKTGYPAEMVDTGMDLEAELGIDSIKRVEILSAMRARVPNLPQVDTAKMGAMRTLAQIVALYKSDEGAAPVAGPPPPAKVKAAALPVASPTATTIARAVVRAVAAPAVGFGAPGLYAGRIAVTPGGGALAAHVVERLRARGIDAVHADAPGNDVAGVIFLGGLTASTADEALRAIREAFAAARGVAASFRARGGLFVTVQDTGGDFGLSGQHDARAWLAGLAALSRTAAREWPDATTRAIDLERGGRTDAQVADALVAELLAGGPEPEVGLRADGERFTLEAAPAALEGSGQPVERGAVFVVTGGARGVTAASIVALARQAQPRFVLLGRTPLEDEPAAFVGANDEAALKRVALDEARAQGRAVTPREVGARVDQILAAREVRATLAALAAAGSEARYAPVDVRDAGSTRALATLLEDVRRTWGPIEGLVHGAGVLADALLEHKTDAQFARVFDTKVLGLRALLDATRSDPLRWLCVFSSVAARAGNAGQSDYAMANEVLNKVAAVEARRRGPACRVVSIGWGPWEGGMVSPSLREHFASRGVALLGVEAGAQAFARELCASARDGVEILIGGGARGLSLAGATTSRAEVHVSAATHPQLASHRIQGKVVVPLVFVVDWFAGMARALTPGCTSVQLRDVRVLRGLTLDPFEGPGVRLMLGATAGATGELSLELRGPGGVVHYAATVAPASAPVRAERLKARELPASPWSSRAEIYAPGVLFHGPDFHAIRELDGIAAGGARAALSRMEDLRWPGGPWTTDPALLDGALQVGVLCAQLAIGATLPLRIGHVDYALGAVRGPIRCGVVVRSQTPERMVFDVALEDPAGVTVAEIVDAEVYAVPSGTTAN